MKKALLVIDHGSTSEASNRMLEDIVVKLYQKRPDLIIKAAHMELASPTIEEGFTACVKEGAQDITAQPFMLAPGRHVSQDIPKLVRNAAQNHPKITWRITDPLGIDDLMIDLILKRAEL